ncbi:hypothetical protein LEP1GSC170_1577, partial [Leptospira interrogans serovar Bataviae str. HAI135]
MANNANKMVCNREMSKQITVKNPEPRKAGENETR